MKPEPAPGAAPTGPRRSIERESDAARALPHARLQLVGISKRFASTQANDDVSLTIRPGEIHAVIGENGAGKSTLMKIVYGVVHADAGAMVWDGAPVRVDSPAHARRLGIGMVFQHFSLFESLSVGENIALALGHDERFDQKALNARIRRVSAEYGLELDPQRHVHHLSVGERQRVEIVRCLLQSPRLLIMDEPTSVLTPQAVRDLFVVLRRLAAEGCSIVYVSHKLGEIQELCDSATVMRAGRVIGRVDPRATSRAELARMMVGHTLPSYERRAHVPGAVMLQVEALSARGDDLFGSALDNVSLRLHAGEVLGIAGISGNGQAELFALLSGEVPAPRGLAADAIRLAGAPCARQGVGERRALGLAAVPEERLGRGAVPSMSLVDNTLLSASRSGLVRRGWLQRGAMQAFARRCIETFDVRCSGPDALAQSLSGGNLQRFIVGREVLREPRVLLIAQPTWGVDVGAAAAIRQQLLDLAARGVAILVISEELDELFEICDSIAVLARGRLSAVLPIGETSAEGIGLAMSGQFEALTAAGDPAFEAARPFAHPSAGALPASPG
ncbi:ABC transporter ATP-binding protein [Robbsia sp. Bb-Pol-6]|uniref:ABC transporter ATP-binding protein n=1 Tax=Robbsia betulipollinis TaxID=2981849 RepID=A0ABT3ZGV8_9BURK|nr:ABC transporter ATP-binding protein [Robbsia betulipollinis]MCY0385765.1 ABC transporter ATP-binding protein [Robbsia betulipollinis]